MFKKLTTEEFIQKAKQIHHNQYDYSKIIYTNSKTKVPIICCKKDENGKEHGTFWQIPSSHLKKRGCPKCFGTKLSSINQFIFNAQQIHNIARVNKKLLVYDYSSIKYYNSNKIPIPIICHEKDEDGKEHGIFLQRPDLHLSGRGCPKCGGNLLMTSEKFILKAQQIHGKDTYVYDKEKIDYKNNHTKVRIICPKHGEFQQTPNEHLRGRDCPICMKLKNKSVIKIINWLNQFKIKYKIEYRFEDCRDKYPLPFDFYLPEHNTCIEYDGQQHFKPICFGGISLERANINFNNTKYHDKIKNEYCLENSIRLIRIPHWNFKDIKSILEKELS